MQPLLLLHGAIGASDQLKDISATLVEKYEVHALDFSGHGGKAFPDTPFSIQLFAEEVVEFMKQKNISAASVFGYSMGGYVAMYLAKHHSQKINKVITLATKFYWDEKVAEKEGKMLDADVIQQKIPAFAKQLGQRHAPQDWKKILNATQEFLLELGRNNTLRLEDYKDISIPSLLLIGDRDKMITFEETLDVYKQLPNAQLSVLPATPHPIEQVDKTLLSFIITKFLD